MSRRSDIFIGLMSGTSLDGADAVACQFKADRVQFLGHEHLSYNLSLRKALLSLLTSGPDEINRCGQTAIQLAHFYAQVVKRLLAKLNLTPQDIAAIGVHGQTIRHCPQLGFTVQLNNPALLAELTNIDVIADFRSRDMAAGGEGAPLVPAFHACIFSGDSPRAIVNIGGIANVTLLKGKTVLGFDCGPGNTLMDVWVQKHCGLLFDENGRWASKGKIVGALLEACLTDPYFKRKPPKSTGREYFNENWLLERFPLLSSLNPEDVQRTLVALTAQGILSAIAQTQPDTKELFICGGGALNPLLMQELQKGPYAVFSTSVLGVDPMYVESMAFAWLAYRFANKKAGNLPAVTRARGERILGALYPAY